MVDAIGTLAPDVLVLTEYVQGPAHDGFIAALAELGLRHCKVSTPVPKQNQVLIASRCFLVDGEILAPEIDPAMPPNALHVKLPELDLELLGVRVPDYGRQPALRGQAWDWLPETARRVADRPFVVAGDLNTDPSYSRARYGDRIGQLVDAGFTHAVPATGASYWARNGHGVRIDHAFVTKGLAVASAEYVTRIGPHVFVGKPGGLSDHAALVVEIDTSSSRPLGG